MVDAGERAHRVEHRVQRRPDRVGFPALAGAGPAHPGGEHVRHRMLRGRREHDLARQPVQQEGLGLRRAHPQRAAEVPVTSVLHDVVGAAARRLAVGEVLGLVGGKELRHEHRPAVLAPCLPPRGPRASRAPGASRLQRAHPGPDERVIGGEGTADRRFGRHLGDRERRFEQPAGVRRLNLRERGRGLAAVVEELVHLRGDPAVARHPARVVVDDHDERVLLLAGVAEHADDLVAVAVGVRVHVARGRHDRAHVLGPSRPGHAALHQRQGRLLGVGRLARRAQASDARQQGQRRGAALLGRVADQALADQLLDIGPAAQSAPPSPPRPGRALSPPGAEQLADHQLGVERAADGEQLPRGAQHLSEQRVRRRCGRCPGAWPLPRRTGVTVMARPAWRLSASARRVHVASFPDARRPMPCPGAARRPFLPVSSPPPISSLPP